ncbi:MAG: ferric reductase-like transmembrane domain-containing protein [Pseudomonadota bacterium]
MTQRGSLAYLWLWALLSAPALAWVTTLARQGAPIAADALNPTGALSAVLFIMALLATPLRHIRPGRPVPLWLVRNRRYLGVASFGYALLHTLFYVLDAGSAANLLMQLPRLAIWTGWVSLLIMAPLALTSTDGWVRRLGPRWKSLQRWAYAAALLGFFHAVSLNDWDDPWEPLIVSAPLIALQIWRMGKNVVRRPKTT